MDFKLMRSACSLFTIMFLFFCGISMAASVDPCMDCHGVPGLDVGGKHLWIYSDAYAMGKHQQLSCSDCHKGDSEFPHKGTFKTRCDLLCHAPGTSHEAMVAAEAQGVHSGIANPPCIGCHVQGELAASGGGVEALCASCHADLEPVRFAYPDSVGAFGYWAHKDAPPGAGTPSCADCHGYHAVKKRDEARKACASSGCHAGEGDAFGELFDHVGWGNRQVLPWVRMSAMALTGAVGFFLLLHAVRRPF